MTDGRLPAVVRAFLVLLLLAGISGLSGCAAKTQDSSESSSPQEEPAAEEQSTKQPGYDSWVVYINDDDSYTKGEITYSIALNLTATNPTQDIAGTYTGEATAKTDTVGEVEGVPLTASAIANSSQLEFTLAEGFDSSGGALTPMTEEELVYSGTGTIVMEASGSGNIGGAGGGFSNTSGQTLEVSTKGSVVTLKVAISGHTYTFEGTISGK